MAEHPFEKLVEAMDIPTEIEPTKNKEDWMVGVPDDDCPGIERPYIKLNHCFFSCKDRSCNSNSWSNARVWSFVDPYSCLQYAVQHAEHSSIHGLTNEDAVNEVLTNWAELPWEYVKDNIDERNQYRKSTETEYEQK